MRIATAEAAGSKMSQTPLDRAVMKGLVYHGPGRRAWEDRPRPQLQDATDAIVRITTSTICGTDLHILKGDVPTVTDGRILGHEGVGVVVEVGAGVSTFRAGDRVLISCITACGRCDFCRKGMSSIAGTAAGSWATPSMARRRAMCVSRMPTRASIAIPADGDEESLVMLSDILPTGFECGVLNGQVQPGDTVAIVGAGPIGLAVLLTAQFYSPAAIIMIDLDDKRLEVARQFGATTLINSGGGGAAERVMALTAGAGVDVAIEAVGVPSTFDICQAIVAPGGRIANVGVHGAPVELHLERLWDRNITITTRLVDTVTTSMLLKVVQSGRLQPRRLVTHRFALDDIMTAYDTFQHAAREGALKVILRNEIGR